MTKLQRKNGFENFFTAKSGNFSFEFCTFQFFFLYDLLTNKGRKLELTEMNPIMETITSSLSLSLCVCVCVSESVCVCW